MKNSIGSFTAKAAAFLLAFGCAVSAWGATTQVATSEALTDAVSAASPGDTIQLSADVTLSATLEITKSITLDLNGKTLTKSLESTTDTSPVIKALSGTVEIKNGSITYDHSAFTGTGAVSKPSVLFVGMNMSNGVYSYGDCNLTLNGVNASVTFPNGKQSMTMVYVESGRLNIVDSNLFATTGASNTKTQYMIYTTAHASAMVDPYVSISGTTTIDTNGKPGIHAIWLQGSKDTLIISGDDVTISADATWKPNSYTTSYGYAINNQSGATCTIEGGKFAGKVWQTKGTITVYGGAFSYPQGTSGQKNKFTLAEGVEYVENTDPATKDEYPYLVGAPAYYVAQVISVDGATTNKYENLMEAINVAYNGGTVELLADVTVDHWHQNIWTLADGSAEYPDGKLREPTAGSNGLTINGNGHSLTINGVDSGSNGNHIFAGSRNLTVSNITINAASGVNGIGLKSGTISDVTFNVAGSDRAIYTSGSAGCEEGEHIEIRNCTFNTEAADSYAIYSCDPENGVDVGTVISGNTFNTRRSVALRSDMQFLNNVVNGAKGVTVAGGSTAVVRGNYFADTTTSRSINVYPSNATIENNVILGPIELENETYAVAPDLSNNYWGGDAPANLPEGVVVNIYYTTYSGYDSPAQDGSLFALSDQVVYVAQVGTTKYETLAAAVAAVPTDGTETTITMLAGETIVADAGITIAAGKNIVLDLNGQTVQMTAASADERWLIKNEGSLTVKDSAENGKLLMSATGQASTAVRKSTIKNMGSLTVESGTIELTYSGTTKEEPTTILNDASDRATSLTVKGGTVVNSANRGTGVYLAVNDTNATVVDVQGGRVEGYGSAVRYYFDDRALTDAKLTFSMSNGTIHGRGMYGIHGMTTSSKDWNGISFDISGGTISCAGLLGRKHVISPLQGAVSISGGTFSGDVYIYGHALEITDGDFAGSVTLHRTKESLESASISGGQFSSGLTIAETTAENTTNPYYNAKFITGGIYGTAPEARNVVDEYVVVDNTDSSTQGDYPKTIGGAAASVTAEGNTTYYATLNDAIAAANEAEVDEITILDNTSESPDSAWKVADGKLVRKTYVAQIGSTKYETLADAFADASEGDTVLLLTDVTEALAYGENISATLNLNGKTISVSSGYAISVTAGELTVTSVVDDDGYATGGIVGAISVSDGATLNLTGGIYDVDWDECDIEGSIAVSSVNRFYESDPTEVEAASAVFTSPVPYEYCSTGFIPGAYDDIYIDSEYYYYVKEGTYVWKITDADGKVAYSEEVPYADDDEEYWDWDWFGEHEMNRNGFTMTLLLDVSADDDNFSAYVSGLTYTVDLGGHTVNQQMGFGVGECDVTIVNGTVSNAGGTAISIANGAQVTLGDGLVIAQSTTGVYVEGGTEEGACSKLTVKNGAAINGTYGVLVFGSGSSNPVTEVVVEGGTITGTTYGISGNGTIEGDTDYSNTRIAISGGTVSGGEVGIYHPQAGELSVSGGTISGKMAIYARSGTIAVTGGSLNATGTSGEYNVSYAGNELQQTGDALVLDAVDYPGGNPTATISGGTFVSVNGDGVASYAATGQSAESGFVSGGTFSSEVPEEYCADGFIPTGADPDTGLYTVKAGSYVAQIGDEKYETFAEAIAAAETYKTANGFYPTITVLDATAEQTNDGWMFSQDGQRLVRKVAMVTTNVDNYATTNYYASAAEAFSAAESAVANKSGTGTSYAYVTLLADDTLPGDATTVLKSNHGRTDRRYIDLNGHTLTAPKGISLEYKSGGFQVYLQDGSAAQTGRVVNPTADDPEAFVVTVGNSVSLTVEGGAIVAKGEGTALKTTGGGRITLKGGSVTADPAGRALNAAGTESITAEADSSVSVTGTLGAPTGELILRGGTFTANAANGELFDVGETGSVAVSGGSFSSAVPAQCIATGYKDAGQIAVVPGYYTVTKEVYTITFLDENDNVIISGQLEYNALYSTLPVPAIPVKVSDDPAFYYKGAWVPSASTSTRATGNATHKLTYTQGKYGFQYGDGLYTNSLANAYKAVADGGTITVLTNAFALTSTTLNLAKDVTIDLNGSTLSMNQTGMLTVSGEGTKVTFANGTIKYGSGTTARDALVKVTSPAEVAFEGVTLQGASYYTTAVSVASGASAAFSGECVVTMPSGKQAVTAADGGTVAISGGLYSTEVPAAYCAADYKPADGTVEHDGKNYYTVTLKRVFSASDMEASSETEAGGIVTVANGVVSTALSGVSEIRFIRAYSGDRFVTLRTSDASNTFALPDDFGTVTKVVAYCGENVTATAGAVPSLFPQVDRAGDSPCATGSFEVKSGVYYSLEANGVRTALHDNKPVAPEEDGDSLNYSVPVSPDPWGVVKFRIIVSDEPLPAGE